MGRLSIGTIAGAVDRHRNLVLEWLFLLWLGGVEGEACRSLYIGDRNRFLRTGLMHWDGSRTALAVRGLLGLRLRYRLWQ
jgi:hypothetical protein